MSPVTATSVEWAHVVRARVVGVRVVGVAS